MKIIDWFGKFHAIFGGTFGLVKVSFKLNKIRFLKVDDMIHAVDLTNERISATIEVVRKGGLNHNANSGIESNKNGELDN